MLHCYTSYRKLWQKEMAVSPVLTSLELDDSSEIELNGTSSASEDDGHTEAGTTDSEQMSQVSMQV